MSVHIGGRLIILQYSSFTRGTTNVTIASSTGISFCPSYDYSVWQYHRRLFITSGTTYQFNKYILQTCLASVVEGKAPYSLSNRRGRCPAMVSYRLMRNAYIHGLVPTANRLGLAFSLQTVATTRLTNTHTTNVFSFIYSSSGWGPSLILILTPNAYQLNGIVKNYNR